MVQVLPYVPGFGERLIGAIGQAGSDVFKSVEQKNSRTALQKLLMGDDSQGAQTQAGNAPQQTTDAAGSPIQNLNNAASEGKGLQDLNPSKILQIYNVAEKAYGPEGAKQLANAYLQKQQLAEKEQQEIRKENRSTEKKFQETEQMPFFEEIAKDRKQIPNSLQSNNQVIDAILKGNVGPTSLANLGKIASDLGVPRSITNALESVDSKEFNNGLKGLIGNTIKDTFRGTTTQREIDIAEAMQAQIGVKPEANLAAAWAVQSDLNLRQEQLRLYDELIEKGVPRTKIPSIVSKQIQPFRKKLSDEYFEAINELRKND